MATCCMLYDFCWYKKHLLLWFHLRSDLIYFQEPPLSEMSVVVLKLSRNELTCSWVCTAESAPLGIRSTLAKHHTS